MAICCSDRIWMTLEWRVWKIRSWSTHTPLGQTLHQSFLHSFLSPPIPLVIVYTC
jgi:hypothetical protein